MDAWIIKDNQYTNNIGLDDSGTETFERDADAALAREICQNSIDAAIEGKSAKVVFKSFNLKAKDLPGYEDIKKEILECYNYKKDDQKEGKKLKSIKECIESDTIKCLRISDFNTTGLVGIREDKRDTPFFNLTKGSGTSNKEDGKGGSKGIGKYACFVASESRIVFYSSKANSKDFGEEEGSIGIAHLRSRPYKDDDNLMTLGTLYYARNEKISPLLNQMNLDPNFTRTEYGTDVFIIGYDSSDDWKSVVTYKILDSFMAAILFAGFEVEVENIIINKDTIYSILESDLFNSRTSTERKRVKAQYELLTEKDINKKTFKIAEDSEITVYVKTYNQSNSDDATNIYELIRYPYMKIKSKSKDGCLSYSALCLMENSTLTKTLREIENPEHTDWLFQKLKKRSKERIFAKNIHNEMIKTITGYINDCLRQTSGNISDLEGAGEFLPAENSPGEELGNKAEVELINISKPKTVRPSVAKTGKIDESGEGTDFGFGDRDGDEEGVHTPSKGGDIPNPNPNPEHEPDDEETGSTSGEKPIIKKTSLGGMKYKAIYNRKENTIDVIFESKYTCKECELQLNQVGFSNDKYPVVIIDAKINGEPCQIEDGKIINFSIVENLKYKIICKTMNSDKFAADVSLCAIERGGE